MELSTSGTQMVESLPADDLLVIDNSSFSGLGVLPGLAPLRFFRSADPAVAGPAFTCVLAVDPIPSWTRGRLAPHPWIS